MKNSKTLEPLTAQTAFTGFSNDKRFNLLVERNNIFPLMSQKPPHIQDMSFGDKKELYALLKNTKRIKKIYPKRGSQSLFSEEELLVVLYLIFINSDKSKYNIDVEKEVQFIFFYYCKVSNSFRAVCINKTAGNELSPRVVYPGIDNPSFKDGDVLIFKKE